MSHVASVEVVINDLACLKKACETLGVTLVEGQKTFKWYGRFLADSDVGRATAKEFNAKAFGKCEHAIKVPGCSYEVGVVKNPTGKGYRLIYDQFGSGGEGIAKKLGGEKLTKLTTEYGAEVATKQLRRKGYTIGRRYLNNGQIKLTATK